MNSATAIYARISDDRADGAGVARQLEDAHALAAKEGWEPAVVYRDDSFSASRYATRPRPAYAAMLQAIRAGEVNRVVVYHTDRLYRQPRELEDIITLAEAGKVQVVSVHSGDLNLSNSDGITMARVLVAFAAKESDDKSRRVSRAKAQARSLGVHTGGPRAFGWLDTMTPHPDEAPLIRTAVTDLLAGASLHDIARGWAAASIGRPQTGTPTWSADVVRKVVSSPRHAGLIGHRAKQQDGTYGPLVIVGKASWEPILDRPTWERLMAVLNVRGAAFHIPHRRSLLTGLLTCGKCGGSMIRSGNRAAPGSKLRSSWRCSPEGGCGGVFISAAPLETMLVEATLQLLDSGELAGMMRQQGAEGKLAETLIRELGDLDMRLEAAALDYARGALTAAAFQAADRHGQAERDKIQAKLAKVTTSGVLAPYVGKPGLLRQRWPQLTDDQRRALISITLGKVEIAPSSKPGMPKFDPSRVRVVAHSGPVSVFA